MIFIAIPTIKTRAEIAPLVCDIEGFSYPAKVWASCTKASAAVNRNLCLKHARELGEIDTVIMLDDDIQGFGPGWVDKMLAPLDDKVLAVSARLVDKNGALAPMMGMEHKPEQGLVEVVHVPSSCIAFRLEEAVDFDERYKGSGFEDTQWCKDMRKEHPDDWVFLVNNDLRMIHYNEKKNQDENWAANKAIYENE